MVHTHNCTNDIDCLSVLGTLCYGDLYWNESPFTCQCSTWFAWHGEGCQNNSFTTYLLFAFNGFNAVFSLFGVCLCVYVLIRNVHSDHRNPLLLTTLWSLLGFVALVLWNVGVILNANSHEIEYVAKDGQTHAKFQKMVIFCLVLAYLFVGLALVHVSLVWINLGNMLASKNPFNLHCQKIATIFVEVLFITVFLCFGATPGASVILNITAQAYIVFCILIHYIGSTVATKQLLKYSAVLFTGQAKQQERQFLEERVLAIRFTARCVIWGFVFMSVFGISTIVMSVQNWREFAPAGASTWKPVVLTNLGMEVMVPFIDFFVVLYLHKMTDSQIHRRLGRRTTGIEG